MVPLDPVHSVVDLARWLRLPAVVVARAGLGTINHTLLSVNHLRSAGVDVAGVVINRYPAEAPGLAEETNLWAISKWGKIPVLCVVPDEAPSPEKLSKGVVTAIETVDWARFTSG
jgi:dethiobiotin synthetase